MERIKVKLRICGSDYCMTTDENERYMLTLADELDKRIARILRENPRISVTQGAVLAALEYADEKKKATVDAENLRSQIQEYLEDSTMARSEAEIAKREVEKLERELSKYQNN